MSYVYFIQAGGERGPIKIGKAKNVNKRREMLQTGHHERLRVLFEMPCGDAAYDLEQRFHSLFDDLRIPRSEWFTWSQDIVDLIDSLKQAIAFSSKTSAPISFKILRSNGNGVRLFPSRFPYHQGVVYAKHVDDSTEPGQIVFKGSLPEWLPVSDLIELCTGLAPLARSHGAALAVTCSRTMVDIAAITSNGLVCLECGTELSDEFHHASTIEAHGRINERLFLIRFCERHPSEEERR